MVEKSKSGEADMSDDLAGLILSMDTKLDAITANQSQMSVSIARLEEKMTARDQACVDKHKSLEYKVKLWVLVPVIALLISVCGYFAKSYMEGDSENKRKTKNDYYEPEVSHAGSVSGSVLRD